jgi:hypothetical protein
VARRRAGQARATRGRPSWTSWRGSRASASWSAILGGDDGHEIGLHVIVLDEHGRGRSEPPEHGDVPPAEALTGPALVNGRRLDCIRPAGPVRFHTGYRADARDRADVSALDEGFGTAVPREYLGVR